MIPAGSVSAADLCNPLGDVVVFIDKCNLLVQTQSRPCSDESLLGPGVDVAVGLLVSAVNNGALTNESLEVEGVAELGVEGGS